MPKFLNLSHKGLEYLDALTYITIRSHDSTKNGYAHPSYEAISELSGLGRTFISESIKRLEKTKLMRIQHSKVDGVCNRYYFSKLESFECIPYTLFAADDLTIYEKAILLCLKQFFVFGCHMSDYTIKQFSKALGITYNQLYKPYKALIAKGYINGDVFAESSFKGKPVWKGMTNKLNWNFHEVLGIPVVDVFKLVDLEVPEKPKHFLKVA